jgi:predicted O-methyltransferase YrrM
MSVLHDPLLERLLAKLHAESDAQNPAIRDHYDERDRSVGRSPEDQAARTKTFLSNKLYALDRDKAEFCYQLCRAIDARRIVEIGTSYGVSTIYLAAALRDNLGAVGGEGVVIGTEHEPEKARAARAHFQEAGLTRFIDLREGDLRETLRQIDGPVDFALVDIFRWRDRRSNSSPRICDAEPSSYATTPSSTGSPMPTISHSSMIQPSNLGPSRCLSPGVWRCRYGAND